MKKILISLLAFVCLHSFSQEDTTILKTYFNTGDTPTEAQFHSLIRSYYNVLDTLKLNEPLVLTDGKIIADSNSLTLPDTVSIGSSGYSVYYESGNIIISNSINKLSIGNEVVLGISNEDTLATENFVKLNADSTGISVFQLDSSDFVDSDFDGKFNYVRGENKLYVYRFGQWEEFRTDINILSNQIGFSETSIEEVIGRSDSVRIREVWLADGKDDAIFERITMDDNEEIYAGLIHDDTVRFNSHQYNNPYPVAGEYSFVLVKFNNLLDTVLETRTIFAENGGEAGFKSMFVHNDTIYGITSVKFNEDAYIGDKDYNITDTLFSVNYATRHLVKFTTDSLKFAGSYVIAGNPTYDFATRYMTISPTNEVFIAIEADDSCYLYSNGEVIDSFYYANPYQINTWYRGDTVYHYDVVVADDNGADLVRPLSVMSNEFGYYFQNFNRHPYTYKGASIPDNSVSLFHLDFNYNVVDYMYLVSPSNPRPTANAVIESDDFGNLTFNLKYNTTVNLISSSGDTLIKEPTMYGRDDALCLILDKDFNIKTSTIIGSDQDENFTNTRVRDGLIYYAGLTESNPVYFNGIEITYPEYYGSNSGVVFIADEKTNELIDYVLLDTIANQDVRKIEIANNGDLFIASDFSYASTTQIGDSSFNYNYGNVDGEAILLKYGWNDRKKRVQVTGDFQVTGTSYLLDDLEVTGKIESSTYIQSTDSVVTDYVHAYDSIKVGNNSTVLTETKGIMDTLVLGGVEFTSSDIGGSGITFKAIAAIGNAAFTGTQQNYQAIAAQGANTWIVIQNVVVVYDGTAASSITRGELSVRYDVGNKIYEDTDVDAPPTGSEIMRYTEFVDASEEHTSNKAVYVNVGGWTVTGTLTANVVIYYTIETL